MLVIGYIDTCYTGHTLFSSTKLALPLLMTGIAADDSYDTLTPDNPAISAHFLY